MGFCADFRAGGAGGHFAGFAIGGRYVHLGAGHGTAGDHGGNSRWGQSAWRTGAHRGRAAGDGFYGPDQQYHDPRAGLGLLAADDSGADSDSGGGNTHSFEYSEDGVDYIDVYVKK